MFKRLKIPFDSLFTFKDPNVDRLQYQINLVLEDLRSLQQQLFIIERPIYSRAYPIIDRLLYQDEGHTGVTSNPGQFENPVALGIGRGLINDVVQISTLTHLSDRIKAGKRYRFNLDGTYSETQASEVHMVGLSDGVGKLLLENI